MEDVVRDLQMRYQKYGDIEIANNITKKSGNNFNFYNQDDPFINDKELDIDLKEMAIVESYIEDYHSFSGGLSEFI